ncbi:MAG: Imidazole glycerol phosphate synthase cyclase subunit [Brockia lithotrophica]|uniref:Imidazole glycerol phosphate synthase subunit HisF n=1 Tax=Brockia lithotrophica TaxID=933949 RepID=A0A2T5G468_9BACL|nr:MAG: Imidazole glycerol phosphate synthase cyclase subunit [Brockia lithotrophica]
MGAEFEKPRDGRSPDACAEIVSAPEKDAVRPETPRRIIPCLDTKDGRVVKGVRFIALRDIGDVAELAARYAEEGADALAVLDISATEEGRATRLDLVRAVRSRTDLPLIVGGGIRSLDDVLRLLEAGATQVSVGSYAVERPAFLEEVARSVGSERLVLALDAKWTEDRGYVVAIRGGKVLAEYSAHAFAREAVERGAGEILLTSVDADGVQRGYDLLLTDCIAREVPVPVIASGGAGKLEHFIEVFERTRAQAALAASVFHDRILTVREVKEALARRGIPVHLPPSA